MRRSERSPPGSGTDSPYFMADTGSRAQGQQRLEFQHALRAIRLTGSEATRGQTFRWRQRVR